MFESARPSVVPQEGDAHQGRRPRGGAVLRLKAVAAWTASLGVDAPIAFMFFASVFVVFAVGAGQLGFYSDDAGFLTSLGGKGFVATLRAALNYVPGRELHIIWEQLIFLIGGYSPSDLGTLHVIQSCLDGLDVALFYLLLRRLRISSFWSVVGAATFAYYPNHGETHYWLSSGPMNIMSTFFFLAFAYSVAVSVERTAMTVTGEPFWLLAIGFLFFALALFTYDQTFFVLLFVLALRATQLARRRIRPDLPVIGTGIAYTIVILIYVYLKRHPQSGPTLSYFNFSHIWSNVELSISLTFGPLFRYDLDFPTQHLRTAKITR